MSFSDIVSLLSTSFPVRVTRGVHQFKIKDVHLQLKGDDSKLTAMVTPGAPFASHVRCVGAHGFVLTFKTNTPNAVATTGFDQKRSFMFKDVDTFNDAPLLLRTLILIISFEDRFRCFVSNLWEKHADPLWSISIRSPSALEIEHEEGSIRLTHGEDCVYIFAYPIEGIYDRYITWSGQPTDDMRSGTLRLEDSVFVGMEEEDGSTLSFAYRYPDEEDEINDVMGALVWIFRAHLSNSLNI